MQKEIFFDGLTAAEVAERLRLIEVAERQKAEHVAVVNAIALTVARSSGCAPTDEVRLNDGRTGVLVGPPSPPLPPHEGRGAEEPGAAEVSKKRRGDG